MIRFFSVLKWLWLSVAIFSTAAFVFELSFKKEFSPAAFLLLAAFASAMSVMNHFRIKKIKQISDVESAK
jgi:hypothetical protein